MRPFFFYISFVQMEDFCHGPVRGTIWALKTDKGGSLMNEQIRYGPGAVPRRNAEGYQDSTAHILCLDSFSTSIRFGDHPKFCVNLHCGVE